MNLTYAFYLSLSILSFHICLKLHSFPSFFPFIIFSLFKEIKLTIQKAEESPITSKLDSFPSDDENKELNKESLYSERGFFVKSVNGFENSNGNFSKNFTVSLYDIPKDSVLEIR